MSGQLNIINVLPGESGYNDFWQVFKVTVPSSYKANQVASFTEVQAAGYKVEAMTALVNCPSFPKVQQQRNASVAERLALTKVGTKKK